MGATDITGNRSVINLVRVPRIQTLVPPTGARPGRVVRTGPNRRVRRTKNRRTRWRASARHGAVIGKRVGTGVNHDIVGARGAPDAEHRPHPARATEASTHRVPRCRVLPHRPLLTGEWSPLHPMNIAVGGSVHENGFWSHFVELLRSVTCRDRMALRGSLTEPFGIMPAWTSTSPHRPALARCESV
ncbi:hypothetical protein Sfulv_60690 [Streptomyces fulvorobeus]|uniref:Uncharacterized protein n=1 Tax=Streptomyces fulvorobeus TaxID=284028 RepID=A0A7J0CFS9_9ACTN|nr:hypothetical protein Sfulv_60690 [Streptomyces fulvorobeus]